MCGEAGHSRDGSVLLVPGGSQAWGSLPLVSANALAGRGQPRSRSLPAETEAAQSRATAHGPCTPPTPAVGVSKTLAALSPILLTWARRGPVLSAFSVASIENSVNFCFRSHLSKENLIKKFNMEKQVYQRIKKKLTCFG